MADNPYPEQIPGQIKPLDKFTFSLNEIENTKRELGLQKDALETRIGRIIEGCSLAGHPLIKWILNVSHDQEELKKLAKGLDRVADLIGSLDDLTEKERVLNYAEKSPGWFMGAFGDFSDHLADIDTATFDEHIDDDVIAKEE